MDIGGEGAGYRKQVDAGSEAVDTGNRWMPEAKRRIPETKASGQHRSERKRKHPGTHRSERKRTSSRQGWAKARKPNAQDERRKQAYREGPDRAAKRQRSKEAIRTARRKRNSPSVKARNTRPRQAMRPLSSLRRHRFDGSRAAHTRRPSPPAARASRLQPLSRARAPRCGPNSPRWKADAPPRWRCARA